MNSFNLSDSISLLRRTPAALNALLRDLPESCTARNEGGETWTPYDIVGHLLHGDRFDWMVRARTILEHGESQPFRSFDRTAQFRAERKPLPQLLDEFAAARAENTAALEGLNLSDADLRKTGTHPVFGQVRLSQLLSTWATHDLNHLHQMSRVMAYQYREAVGPWVRYLGVLHCDGHGE